jgi:hypothetical protein
MMTISSRQDRTEMLLGRSCEQTIQLPGASLVAATEALWQPKLESTLKPTISPQVISPGPRRIDNSKLGTMWEALHSHAVEILPDPGLQNPKEEIALNRRRWGHIFNAEDLLSHFDSLQNESS